MENISVQYKNPWHDGTQNYGPAFYTCYTKHQREYRGFMVFHRSGGFDYVFNGSCITQRAGASKYKEVIDGLFDGSEHGSDLFAKAAITKVEGTK